MHYPRYIMYYIRKTHKYKAQSSPTHYAHNTRILQNLQHKA